MDNGSKVTLGAIGLNTPVRGGQLGCAQLAFDLAEWYDSRGIEFQHRRGKVCLWAVSLNRLSRPDSSHMVLVGALLAPAPDVEPVGRCVVTDRSGPCQ